MLAALRLHRLLGHKLRPGEQRLLRLQGLVVVTVAVPVDRGGNMAVAVGMAAVDWDQLDRRPDAVSVVVAAAVPVDLYGLRLDFDLLPASSTSSSSETASASLAWAKTPPSSRRPPRRR